MESLYGAQKEMKQLRQEETALEEEMLTLLDEKSRAATSMFPPEHQRRLLAVDTEIAEVRAKQAELQVLIDYYEAKGHCAVTAEDLFLLVYSARRADMNVSSHRTLAGANASLLEQANRWSESNAANRITSLLLATPTIFFGILEGPRDAVEKTFAVIMLDRNVENVSVIVRRRTESRDFPCGLKLHIVEDDLVSTFIDEMRMRGEGSKNFCPADILKVVLHGGDPSGIAPSSSEKVVLTCMLDTLCGAVHHADRYVNAAKAFDETVAKHNGFVCERFGEFTTAVFPMHSATPATSAVAAAKRIRDEVPYCVLAVHIGEVLSISMPNCIAVGAGIRETQQLLFLAEHHRWPLLISPPAADRCNHAELKMDELTIDNVLYYTLKSIGNERLPPPVEIFKVVEYNPRDEPLSDANRPNIIRDPTSSEICERNKLGAQVAGGISQLEIREAFRTLDITDSGWISKKKFRTFVSSSPQLKLFPEELSASIVAKIEHKMERLNQLGDERLSFQEFGLLYLMLLAHQ